MQSPSKTLFQGLLLTLFLGQAGVASAGCNIELLAYPKLPETISSKQVIGATIYEGQFTWLFTNCYNGGVPSMSQNRFMVAISVGTPNYELPIRGVKGLQIRPNDFRYIKGRGAPESTGFMDLGDNIGPTAMLDGSPETISFTIDAKVKITTTDTTISGTFPNPMDPVSLADGNIGALPFRGAWVAPLYFTHPSYNYDITNIKTSIIAPKIIDPSPPPRPICRSFKPLR